VPYKVIPTRPIWDMILGLIVDFDGDGDDEPAA
jgi:hypothetical protein